MTKIVPTKYLFCIYSPKKVDYMIASFPTLKLAEYELSRLQTDEFFSDASVAGPIISDMSEALHPNDRPFLLFYHDDLDFVSLSKMVASLKEDKSRQDDFSDSDDPDDPDYVVPSQRLDKEDLLDD